MQTRSGFHHQIQALEEEILLMGSMVEKQLDRAIAALKALDYEAARRVIAGDDDVDRQRFQIEEHAVHLMATQQPMASDLRILVAALNIIVDMERMGDHAEGIAKIVLMHEDRPLLKPLIDIPRMAEIAKEMLKDVLDSFVNGDVELAMKAILKDDMVDQLKDQVFRELLTYMMSDPSTITRAMDLILVSRHLERIADHATNIGEYVIFMVKGKDVRHQGPLA